MIYIYLLVLIIYKKIKFYLIIDILIMFGEFFIA